MVLSFDYHSKKKNKNKKEKVKENVNVLKYGCFHVTFKITPLLVSTSLFKHKFIDTTYTDLVCFIFIGFIHVENES